MKTLRYGPLTVQVDLDPSGEEIFMDQLREIIRIGEADYRWRQKNESHPSPQNEEKIRGVEHQEATRKQPQKTSKQGMNKNRKED